MSPQKIFQLTDQVFHYMQEVYKCCMGLAEIDAVVRPIHFSVDLLLDCELLAGRIAQAYHTRSGFIPYPSAVH